MITAEPSGEHAGPGATKGQMSSPRPACDVPERSPTQAAAAVPLVLSPSSPGGDAQGGAAVREHAWRCLWDILLASPAVVSSGENAGPGPEERPRAASVRSHASEGVCARETSPSDLQGSEDTTRSSRGHEAPTHAPVLRGGVKRTQGGGR